MVKVPWPIPAVRFRNQFSENGPPRIALQGAARDPKRLISPHLMVSMVLVRTSIKTSNPLFFKMCKVKSELLHLITFSDGLFLLFSFFLSDIKIQGDRRFIKSS